MNSVRRIVAAAALAVACFSTLADAADPPALRPCAREFDVPITVYNQSYMTSSELDAIVETARGLWQPYGVTIAPGRGDGLVVIVSDGSTDRDGSRQARKVLGTTTFSGGHAAPYIRLWVGAAEALLVDSLSPHPSNMPTTQRGSLLVPMLGVALAHELGHVLLDTSRHALYGLLQRVIPFRDLEHPTSARLGLNEDQQLALCAVKDNVVK